MNYESGDQIHDPGLTLTGWTFLGKTYIITIVLWFPETTIQ